MTAAPVLQPLTDAGVHALLRSGGRLWAGPSERLSAEIRDYIEHNAPAIAGELDSIGNHLVGAVVDPRPDLTSDCALWARLLRRARALDGFDGDGVFWTLLGARAMSTEVIVTEKSWRLQARQGCEADYQLIKPHLLRNRSALTELLRELAQEKTS